MSTEESSLGLSLSPSSDPRQTLTPVAARGVTTVTELPLLTARPVTRPGRLVGCLSPSPRFVKLGSRNIFQLPLNPPLPNYGGFICQICRSTALCITAQAPQTTQNLLDNDTQDRPLTQRGARLMGWVPGSSLCPPQRAMYTRRLH